MMSPPEVIVGFLARRNRPYGRSGGDDQTDGRCREIQWCGVGLKNLGTETASSIRLARGFYRGQRCCDWSCQQGTSD